jgi:hypothetical protein
MDLYFENKKYFSFIDLYLSNFLKKFLLTKVWLRYHVCK